MLFSSFCCAGSDNEEKEKCLITLTNRLDFEDITLIKEISELNISPAVTSQSTLDRKKKMMGSSKLKMPLPIERSIQVSVS